MKKFRCEVCGYILETDSAPKEECPVCGAEVEAYIEIED